jgi:tetratricopeptide (TPR) repeat protein
MSAQYTELAAFPPASPFPRWRRVLGKVLLFSLTVALTVIPVRALEMSVAQDNGVQPASDVRRPQAGSQQERHDFNAAYALSGAAAEEAAANEFAARYPASELRHYLYSSAMLQYQRENNPAKMLVMGERVLELDPDNPLALVLTATALADSLSDRDRDREKKISTIKRNSARAIQSAEAGYVGAPGSSAAVYKTTLQSMAYSALGIMKLKTGDDAGAEKDLKNASELARVRPDASVWYHLALAQDHRKKYAAALNSVEQALQLASSDPELQRLAEVEHERLAGLAKGAHNPTPAGPQ